MEENKNKNEQSVQNVAGGNLANRGDGENGGRRRRKHKPSGGQGENRNENRNENREQGGKQQQQPKQQNQGGQNAQNQGGKQKNKNQPQNQQAQNKPNQQQSGKNQKPQKNQNGGGRDKTNDKNERKKEENRKDTYVYMLDGNLYINLTNKCSNGCDFCVRNERTSYYGNYLWLHHGDPTAEKVIAALKGFGDLTRFKEVVFCGFGEPTYKVAEMIALCDFFHEKGLQTRLNTNGQGNLINKRDITPELKGKIDLVNVSLNASCAEKYQPICRSQFGEAGFTGMIEFAKLCKRNGVACRFSIVDCIGEDEVEACKRLAESIKIPLYIRKYIADS